MLLIKNIKILTASDKNYNKADILIQEGKIADIAENISAEGCDVINGEGLIAAPGFIDAHTHLGMWEDAIEFEGADGNEMTDPITPEMRAIDGINPMDRTFKDAYTAGIT
ncbi:MAG: amidohydrolase, partial [Firmicutes bacterium]|nr:amidohydrolase [Bacillota bacterium]